MFTKIDMPHANTRFHSVGQGCFYSGEIYCATSSKPLRVVYDCGSETRGGSLEREIRSYQQLVHDSQLDMLVISHLDADHVNGLSLLLDNGLTAENVFLPYLTPAERAIAAAGAGDAVAPDYYELLSDPVGFLEGRGVKNIIFVNSGPDDQQSGENAGLPPVAPAGENGGPPNLGDLEDDTEGKTNFDQGEKGKSATSNSQPLQPEPPPDASQHGVALDSRPRQRATLFFKTDSSVFRLTSCWQAKFFHRDDLHLAVKRISETSDFTIASGDSTSVQRYKRFLAAVNGQFGTLAPGRLIAAIRNAADRKKLRNCYHHIEGNHNDVSLALWHAPLSFPAQTCITSGQRVKGLRPSGPWSNCNGGTFLTGDLTFTDSVMDRFQTRLGNELNHSAFLAVPHHGSARSWNPRLLAMMQPGALSIVSAGLRNSYHHPNGEVIDSIESRGERWFRSSERDVVEMHIEVK